MAETEVVNKAVCFLRLQHCALLKMNVDSLFCSEDFYCKHIYIYIRDAYPSKDVTCVSQLHWYSWYWIIWDVRESHSPPSRWLKSQVKKCRPNKSQWDFSHSLWQGLCRLCPRFINLSVLNHSVTRHNEISSMRQRTTRMTWRTIKRHKIDVETETHCP